MKFGEREREREREREGGGRDRQTDRQTAHKGAYMQTNESN